MKSPELYDPTASDAGGVAQTHGMSLGDPTRIKVLSYSRVKASAEIVDRASVPVSAFRRQLEFLDKMGFTSITVEDYRLFLQGEINLPRKPVMITLDGYRDAYDVAFPVLLELGMRAIVFVVADRSVVTNNWEVGGGLSGLPLLDDRRMLEMHSAGFEIGSHSLTYVRLTEISSDEAWKEISRSRLALEILLNAPVQSFAYPFGDVNMQVKGMVKDAGYTIGFGGWAYPGRFRNDRYEVRRAHILNNVGSFGFALKLLSPF